jgi:hypothetical protein
MKTYNKALNKLFNKTRGKLARFSLRGLLSSISRTSYPLDTLYTSPEMEFPTTVLSSDAISVEAGLEYSLDDGAWTSVAGTRGAAEYIQFRLTSSDEYETEVSLDATVDSVVYTFSLITMEEPDLVLLQDGEEMIFQDGEAMIW